jgi:hypothetical protein
MAKTKYEKQLQEDKVEHFWCRITNDEFMDIFDNPKYEGKPVKHLYYNGYEWE